MGDAMPRPLPLASLLAAATILTSHAAARADDAPTPSDGGAPPSAGGDPPSAVDPARSPVARPAEWLATPPASAPHVPSSYYPLIGFAEVTVALLFAGGGTQGPHVRAVPAALAVPIIHAAYGNPGRGLLSFGMRVALSLAGYQISGGDRGTCHNAPFCQNTPGTIGVAAGYVTAAVIDLAFLKPDRARKRAPTRWWAPTAAPAAGGVSVGVVGGF